MRKKLFIFVACLTLETGGMRRVWLRGLENVWKRYLIHCSAFNLSLVMRNFYQVGTPRALDELRQAALSLLSWLLTSSFRQRLTRDGSGSPSVLGRPPNDRNSFIDWLTGHRLRFAGET